MPKLPLQRLSRYAIRVARNAILVVRDAIRVAHEMRRNW